MKFSSAPTRVYDDGRGGVMKYCEERTVLFAAAGARQAIEEAKRRGQAGEFEFVNAAGVSVRFRFIGITDIMRLGPEAADDEVWYDVKKRKTVGTKLVLSNDELDDRLRSGGEATRPAIDH